MNRLPPGLERQVRIRLGLAVEAKPDWRYWRAVPQLTVHESTCLLLGLDPERIPKDLHTNYDQLHALVPQYKRFRRLLTRALDSRDLVGAPSLLGLLDWAGERDVEMSPDTIQQAAQLGDVRRGSATQAHGAGAKQGDGTDKPIQASVRGESNRSSTLAKVLLGLAVKNYGYDPQADSNAATGTNHGGIPAALESIGLAAPTPGTLRKHLREAWQALSDAEQREIIRFIADQENSRRS